MITYLLGIITESQKIALESTEIVCLTQFLTPKNEYKLYSKSKQSQNINMQKKVYENDKNYFWKSDYW